MRKYTSKELDTLVKKICKKLGWKWDGRKPTKPTPYPDDPPHAPQNDNH